MNACVCMYMYVCVHAYVRACVLACVRVCLHVCVHVCVHAGVHVRVHSKGACEPEVTGADCADGPAQSTTFCTVGPHSNQLLHATKL